MWAGPSAIQANGKQVTMPLNQPFARRSKLALSIDTRWANNYGYRPVEVTISSPKPTTADRLITIRLSFRWWGGQSGTVEVEQDFELPLGKTSATTMIAVPQYQLATQYLWWDVWVDGVKDRDLSLDEKVARGTMVGGISPGAGTGVSCLVVGPPNQNRLLMVPTTSEFEFLSLKPAEFPRRWIDYTCLDVVALSFGELQLLSQLNPQALEALRHWLNAGGQLWVSDVGSELEQLAEVSKLLRVRGSLAAATEGAEDEDTAAADEDAPIDVGWKPVRFRRGNPEGQSVTFLNLNTGASRVATDSDLISRLQNDPNFVVTGQQFQEIEEPRTRRWSADSSRWFVEQRSGLGAVRAFRGAKDEVFSSAARAQADPNASQQPMGGMGLDGTEGQMMGAEMGADDADRMPTALSMALRSTRRWEARHGMTPDSPNSDFAKLLVPGVGLAPVTEFRVLITLFVVLIGPANYWLLKRVRRLHLLVLTVPLAAVVTTAALFAYAILSDGFGTTVRAHSFTTLNQRTGEAACWSRLSYYSGLAPGEGLTMPADVALYPIIPGWNESSVEASVVATRELLWEPNQAKLMRGWLRSRTPTQYLTVRARKSPHRLELLPAGGKIRATNQLGSHVDFLLVIDDKGELFAGEKLAAGARTNLESIPRTNAIRRLREFIVENEPQAPDALAAEDSDFAEMQRRQQRQVYRRLGLQYSPERLGRNLVHDELAKLGGLSGLPALQLPPRSYVAVTETGPEVAFGISGARQEASFHVTVGQW